MHSIIFVWAIVILLSGCQTIEDKSQPRWQKKDFVDRHFVLDDARKIDEISFMSDHRMAAVTFGDHVGDMYKICAPLMYWRLRDGRLEIYDEDKEIYATWTFLRRDGDFVYVRNEQGKTLRYINK